jgi:hypothetical protein
VLCVRVCVFGARTTGSFRPVDEELFQRKVELLLACAVQAGCTHLILGAWGCGA